MSLLDLSDKLNKTLAFLHDMSLDLSIEANTGVHPLSVDDLKGWSMETFKAELEHKIKSIVEKPLSASTSFDPFETEKSRIYKESERIAKRRHMDIGNILQIAMGRAPGCEDLKQGKGTGLDTVNSSRLFILELKKGFNTDNSSGRSKKYDHLVSFKKSNPEYTCIYGFLVCKSKKDFENGKIKRIMMNGVEIVEISGMALLRFIFGRYAHEVLEFIKCTVDKYFMA